MCQIISKEDIEGITKDIIHRKPTQEEINAIVNHAGENFSPFYEAVSEVVYFLIERGHISIQDGGF